MNRMTMLNSFHPSSPGFARAIHGLPGPTPGNDELGFERAN
jgi:hypothetical protein